MIFVTGGTGFLGRHLIPTLYRAGHSLRVLTRQPEANGWLCKYPNVEVVRGDLTSGDGLDAVQGCEYVIHAAGLFSMWNRAGDFDATNVIGTENLLAVATQADVKRLVYVSTIAVIGNPQPNRLVDEAHPPRPADPYQASKLKAEQVIKRYHYQQDIETIILRPGAFYGPLGDYAFNRLFFTDPMRGIIMQMDGGHYRIFPVYIGDVAQSILLALTQGKSGETYNICGEPISHRAAFDIICKEADIHWFRVNLPGVIGVNFSRFLNLLSRITRQEPFYPLGLRSYVFNDWHVSSDKARRELGFVPIDFADGAKRTIAWYRAGKPDWLTELEC
jgi:nucleoside-diphosphate-sugar epimerase